jgi:Flp pilus assembly protein TadG
MSLLHRCARRVREDRRGAIVLESLVAFLPIFAFFIGVAQVADGYAAQLIVRRAASAATRAAVVVLPDDGVHYGDGENRGRDSFLGGRRLEVERAAKLVTSANASLSKVVVDVRGTYSGSELTTVHVSADYRCLISLISLFCGRDKIVKLQASAALPYQGAEYAYEP